MGRGRLIEKRREQRGKRRVGRNMAVSRRRRRRKEGWSTTRKAERSECNGEGEVKEESRRRGGRGEGKRVVKE